MKFYIKYIFRRFTSKNIFIDKPYKKNRKFKKMFKVAVHKLKIIKNLILKFIKRVHFFFNNKLCQKFLSETFIKFINKNIILLQKKRVRSNTLLQWLYNLLIILK